MVEKTQNHARKMATTKDNWQAQVRNESGDFVVRAGQEKGKKRPLTLYIEDDEAIAAMAEEKGVSATELLRFIINAALTRRNIKKAIADWDGRSKFEG